MEEIEPFKEGSLLYNHEDFCKFLQEFRKDKPALSKWLSYPLWILSYLPYVFFLFAVLIMISICLHCAYSGPRRKYPKDTHRMVIKEGLFWDSVEYHER